MEQDHRLREVVALSLIGRMGPVTFKRVREAVQEDLSKLFSMTREEFDRLAVPRLSYSDLKAADLFKEADRQMEKAAENGIKVVTFFDGDYPQELKEIYDPPILLYVKGNLPSSQAPKVAVVGSRLATFYGLQMARRISGDLAGAGVVIVSGFAKGIDLAAHEGALAGGGVTIAVLAGGLLQHLRAHPNQKILDKITEKGALVSEYPLETAPQPGFFPVRNRIISGLSRAVLVVQAAERSGALITADAALEQGRDVFAVPGNADVSRSAGVNRLIQQGAKLTVSASDILEELCWETRDIPGALPDTAPLKNGSKREVSLSTEEEKVLSCLNGEALSIDELAETSCFPASRLAAALSLLELKGLIRQMPGKNFKKVEA
ncbi:MAG: DNA-protecting protein DprA [Candidatus Omnitrophica bacterium]|nr:DNA-protecting protein DprA [Candidatus Omnitrophota bacterium]